MRNQRPLILLLCLILWGGAWARLGDKPDPYEKIEDPAKARKILDDVMAYLKKNYNFRVSYPVQMNLVHESVMDAKFAGSPYKGAEVGLYTFEGGKHQIYVMKGWSRDVCSGVTAHEYTHAWQFDNCPRDQDLVLREGFACWVEMKYYDSVGAYQHAEDVRNHSDPVYGVGIKTMLALEDKVGPKKLVGMITTLRSARELDKVLSDDRSGR